MLKLSSEFLEKINGGGKGCRKNCNKKATRKERKACKRGCGGPAA